jgi:uncharacterized phage infection (PIP) family protein YhgE
MPRPTISQRIALEGGDEVKRQLNELGEAGKKAFQKLQESAKAAETLNGVSPTLESLRAKAGELGFSFGRLGATIHGVGGSIRETAVAGGLLATAIAGVVTGFVSLVRHSAEAGQEMRATAEAIGLTASQFKQLSFAFRQNEVDRDQFTRGMAKFNATLDKTGKEADKFSEKQRSLTQELTHGHIKGDEYAKKLSELHREAANNTDALSRLGVQVAKNNDGSVNTEETLKRVAEPSKG